MPFPSGTPVVTLTGTLPKPVAGSGFTGRIVLTPSAVLTDSTHKAVYPGGGSVDFDANGAFTVQVIPNDAAGILPAGWKWQVDIQPAGGQRVRFWTNIPTAAGPTVDLSTLVPTTAPDGTGQSLPPSGPAGGDLAGSYPNPTLSTAIAASIASKAAGPAGATDNAVVRFDGTTGLVVQNSTVIVGDDGSVMITGNLTDAGTFIVRDSNTAATKGYRFRTSGSSLDTESGGTDWFWSTFPNADFSGVQNNYFRMESGAAILHVTAEARFDASAFSGRGHTLDGPGNKVGFYGANPATKPTVSGSRGGNAALASLLTALATLGLITDSTTA